ncbi:DUF1707 SHOCT-like domain-containing protein [[Mycobacterium] burgundiense]|uniref:DUF1707 domain-containing protein n=1 Tax=[Mycobacterium] burgundiense TaxID=3064286 RepID=A0ABN9NSG8_9MYCO|nr:DUF1707 domain-containing protein [Mycolicibacterium sp. MU0053]CAJ1511232.1 DUF1707 domain-containing protein [Mycolicibacterium sp. MU0053]
MASTSYDRGVATRQTANTRAKDSDRNDTCKVLDSALADGQLSGEEHRQRVASATSAATLGQLAALVDDLQNANAPVQLPSLQRPAARGRGALAAVAAVLVLLGIGIGWGFFGGSGSTPGAAAGDPGARPDGIAPVVLTPPRQLHSLGGLTGLFEQMRQKFGDTMGYRAVIYPDYASVNRLDPTEERRELSYSYRGGWDDPSSSAKSDNARLVDLSRFDHRAIVGVLRGAPETLGLKPADVTTSYLIVDPSGDPATPEAVEISVYISSEFGSGSIELNPDGSQKRISYP